MALHIYCSKREQACGCPSWAHNLTSSEGATKDVLLLNAQPALLSSFCGLCCRVVDQDGVQLVTDTVSYELLKGSTVDYTTDLIRSAFEVGLGSQCPPGVVMHCVLLLHGSAGSGPQGVSIRRVTTCWPTLMHGSAADGCQCLLEQSTMGRLQALMHASAASLAVPPASDVQHVLSVCIGAESCQCVLQVTQNPNASGSCGCGASFEAKM